MPATFDGKRALRADLRVEGSDRNLRLRAIFCSAAKPIDLRGKTLSATVRLEGPTLPPTTGEHSIALYVWTSINSLFVGDRPMPAANTWYTVSGLLERAELEELAAIGVYVYVNGSGDGSSWAGSVYMDDVRIE